MLTIFTPTYNRKALIKLLFNSLLNQTSYNFEWIVVDDGSSDNTKEFFDSLGSLPFNIKYIYQRNQGKHIAFNKGIKEAQGDYFICIDSDDTLTNNAVEIILNHIDQYKSENKIGFIYPRVNKELITLPVWKEIDRTFIDIIDTKEIYNVIETAIVFKTKILQKYQFPIFKSSINKNETERFCPEGILYNQLIKEGKFIALQDGFYISEYQEDGLTKNVFNLWIKNRNGVLYSLNQKYKILGKYTFKRRLIGRVKCILNINGLCLKTNKNVFKNTPSAVYSFLLYFPSILFTKIRWNNE